MKLTPLLLAGSLAANAAFLAFALLKSPASGRSTPFASETAKTNADEAARKSASIANAAGQPLEKTQMSKAWEQIPGGDFHTLPDRLRAAGFPPAIIRAIVSAQVYELFAGRRKALISQQEDVPFWKTQQRYFMDPKAMAELREINRAQMNLMKELLGPDGFLGSDEARVYQKRQFGDLAPDKLEQMQSVLNDYNDLRQQIYQTANGVILPEDREKLALLEKEQRTDLGKLLSPEELENYDLRSSNTANALRAQLGNFKPTEAEFRALFRATRDAEEKFGSLTNVGGTPDQIRQIQMAVLEQVTPLLPAERIAELKQAADPAYQQVNRLVARLDLPPTAATQIVAVQQDVQKRAAALRGNRDLPADDRNRQLAALQTEAATSLLAPLGGARGLEAYKQYGGQWLQALVPRPPPGTPTPPPAK